MCGIEGDVELKGGVELRVCGIEGGVELKGGGVELRGGMELRGELN